jgi:hypothetical protein
MYQHQLHELAGSRARDLQRLADRQRLVSACREESKRQNSAKTLKRSGKAFRQQARGAPQH